MGFVMPGHGIRTPRRRAGFAALACLALAGCAGEFSILEPEGPAAAQVADLWWAMLAGALLILSGVMAAALYALKGRRRGREISERRVLVGWGLVFPVVTLALLMGWAFVRGEHLLARSDPDTLVIQVHAGQWFWDVNYPGGQRTVNAIHVPAGTPFHVEVTSGDVIHSFWIPRLGGKIDAIPGKVNRIALQADRPGFFRGLCAEYCGRGHAHMLLDVHVHPPEVYRAALDAAALHVPHEEQLPVLVPRRTPAQDVIRAWGDYFLQWLGLR